MHQGYDKGMKGKMTFKSSQWNEVKLEIKSPTALQ